MLFVPHTSIAQPCRDSVFWPYAPGEPGMDINYDVEGDIGCQSSSSSATCCAVHVAVPVRWVIIEWFSYAAEPQCYVVLPVHTFLCLSSRAKISFGKRLESEKEAGLGGSFGRDSPKTNADHLLFPLARCAWNASAMGIFQAPSHRNIGLLLLEQWNRSICNCDCSP